MNISSFRPEALATLKWFPAEFSETTTIFTTSPSRSMAASTIDDAIRAARMDGRVSSNNTIALLRNPTGGIEAAQVGASIMGSALDSGRVLGLGGNVAYTRTAHQLLALVSLQSAVTFDEHGRGSWHQVPA